MFSLTVLIGFLTLFIAFIISVILLPYVIVKMLTGIFEVFTGIGLFFRSFFTYSMKDFLIMLYRVARLIFCIFMFLVLSIFVFAISYSTYMIASELVQPDEDAVEIAAPIAAAIKK